MAAWPSSSNWGDLLMGWFSWLKPHRRSLENPTTSLSNPAEWFVKLFGGEASDAGVGITPDKALQVATFWQCVHLLADDFGKLPTVVFKHKNNDSRYKDRKHPAYYLLRRKANEFMAAGMFKRTLLHHALVYGNGYAWVRRDGGAAPTELLLLNPERTEPFWAQGRLWYTTWVDNNRFTLRPDEIFHLHGVGFDGTKGYSIAAYAANSLGLTIAAEKFGSKHFANGSRASGVLHYPGRLKPEAKQNLKESFEKAHQGLDNAHRTIVLEEGAKFEPLTIPPNEAQFIELREFQRKEIASWFKIPPSKLGDPDSVSYNSLEQWNQAYLESALDPWLVAFEEEAFDKLLTEVQKRRESHFVEFNRAALLRTSLEERYRAYGIGMQWGWLSVNDILRKENEPPIGPEGDTHLVQQNMADLKNVSQLGMSAKPTEPTEPTEPDGGEPKDPPAPNAKRDLLVDTFGRVIRRVVGTLTKAAARDDFWQRVESILAEYQQAFVRITRPVLGVLAITDPSQAVDARVLAGKHLQEIREQLGRLRERADMRQEWDRQSPALKKRLMASLLAETINQPVTG